MSIESRPGVYFPTMTDDELLRYAAQYATTELEKELIARFERLHANPECVPSVEAFRDEVWSVADTLSDVDSPTKKAASKALFDAIQRFEDA